MFTKNAARFYTWCVGAIVMLWPAAETLDKAWQVWNNFVH